MDTSVKRLAIEVEDHDLDDIDFEGEIEEGQYGAGAVKVWDSGEYELLEREDGFLRVDLKGKHLTGPFKLIKMNWEGGDKWLLVKSRQTKTPDG